MSSKIIQKLKKRITKLSKKTLVLYLIIAIAVPVSLFYIFTAEKTEAAWYDDTWSYRQAVTVTVTSSASDVSNLQTRVTMDTNSPITAGKMQSSCQDLRFTNKSGDLLPYYIDSGCNGASTKIWVLADLVPKNTTTYTMYVYYGNPSAVAGTDATRFTLYNGLVGYWNMNESSWNGK